MDAINITIAPDRPARCLRTEAVPWHELRRLEIRRATNRGNWNRQSSE
jgi:hypothetical protein